MRYILAVLALCFLDCATMRESWCKHGACNDLCTREQPGRDVFASWSPCSCTCLWPANPALNRREETKVIPTCTRP